MYCSGLEMRAAHRLLVDTLPWPAIDSLQVSSVMLIVFAAQYLTVFTLATLQRTCSGNASLLHHVVIASVSVLYVYYCTSYIGH
jgi:hypothetical protein